MPRPFNILPGTLELLIMKAFVGAESIHGFDILRWLQAATDEELVLEEGSLYPALHRMERRGWLEPEWGISDRGRRAKYYRLTGAGRPRGGCRGPGAGLARRRRAAVPRVPVRVSGEGRRHAGLPACGLPRRATFRR